MDDEPTKHPRSQWPLVWLLLLALLFAVGFIVWQNVLYQPPTPIQ